MSLSGGNYYLVPPGTGRRTRRSHPEPASDSEARVTVTQALAQPSHLGWQYQCSAP